MEMLIAKYAGFCFGVERAIKFVYDNINIKPLYTYGPIIHNRQVVDELNTKGCQVLENLDGITNGTVVIRSHGVSPDIYKQISNNGLQFIDATCPYVKRIHKIVNEHYDNGYKIIIIGSENHPEVIGINGWCNNEGIIINTIDEAEKLTIGKETKLCIVAQTTFNQYNFDIIVEVLKNLGYNLYVFSTICSSTYARQKEALEISKKVDRMIIIGGKHSSNTQKLYCICKEQCENTYHIETIDDLPLNDFNKNDKIGITAGASTPKNIIEEVIITMSELLNENQTFAELLEQSLVKIQSGEVIKGKVIQVTPNEIYVNVGYKSDGILPKSEYTSDANLDLTSEFKEDDEIEVLILRVNDGEGQVLLSKRRIASKLGLQLIEKAYKSKENLSLKISKAVKGGVISMFNEVSIFIPSSQLDDSFVDDLTKFVGQTLDVRIIEFDARRGRVIGSRRVILSERNAELKIKTLATLEEGKKVKGRVKRITKFGAFIDLGGMDGLLHITEISWARVNKPTDLLTVGEEIEVLVKQFDKENQKVSLSMKFPEENPWLDAENKFKKDTIIEGKVVRLADFGAFVEIEKGVDALLHVSQISNDHINKPSDILKVGDVITAKIMDLDIEKKRISISKKVLEEKEVVEEEITEDTEA